MTLEQFILTNAPGCVQGDASYRLLQAAYRAGAEAMRERAAKVCEAVRRYDAVEDELFEAISRIRALPLD